MRYMQAIAVIVVLMLRHGYARPNASPSVSTPIHAFRQIAYTGIVQVYGELEVREPIWHHTFGVEDPQKA